MALRQGGVFQFGVVIVDDGVPAMNLVDCNRVGCLRRLVVKNACNRQLSNGVGSTGLSLAARFGIVRITNRPATFCFLGRQ